MIQPTAGFTSEKRKDTNFRMEKLLQNWIYNWADFLSSYSLQTAREVQPEQFHIPDPDMYIPEF